MSIKIFYDGANLKDISELSDDAGIDGFTTNPTLMRKDEVRNYSDFIKWATIQAPNKPFSFEVFADDLDDMYFQAKRISHLGGNIYVKIPITNTKRESTKPVIKALLEDGIKVNITAVMLYCQVAELKDILREYDTPSIVSVFAGRISDTGVCPMHTMYKIGELLKYTNSELLWASTRSVYNITEAGAIGADIITCNKSIIDKYWNLKNKNLRDHSLDTVKMFYNDAKKAGYTL